MPTLDGVELDPGELDAAFIAARAAVDASGYGRWISDTKVHEVVAAIVIAVEKYRTGATI